MREEEGSADERPRPRVVDKRVSARDPAAAPDDAPGPRAPAATAPPSATSAAEDRSEPSAPARVWTPEQEAEAQSVADEIAATPATSWIANIGLTLANVAAAKLDRDDPAEAQLAIDALAGLLSGAGGKWGDIEAPLRQALAELQLAYARAVRPPP